MLHRRACARVKIFHHRGNEAGRAGNGQALMIQIEACLYFPSGRADCLLKTQPADDIFDHSVDAAVCDQMGVHDNLTGTVDVGAVETPQRQVARGKTLKKKCANMRFVSAATMTQIR